MSMPFISPFGANVNPFGQRNQNGMHSLAEEDENDLTKTGSPGFNPGAFGGDAHADEHMRRGPPNPESYPAQYNFARRTSVSAESLKPSADSYDNWSPPRHEKTAEQIDRLKKAIGGNFLFSHLDDEQTSQILGALVEKPIPAKGIKVSVWKDRNAASQVAFNILMPKRHSGNQSRRCRRLLLCRGKGLIRCSRQCQWKHSAGR